jgi:glycerophosphoryl diester phosphodiesterase
MGDDFLRVVSEPTGSAGGAGPLIVAHRGASAGMVDNSLAAFEQAISLGAEMIEFDVRRTHDGKLIAFHDGLLGGAAVGSLTHAEIGRRAGHLPPRLEEVLELARGRIALDVELKESGYLSEVVAALGDGPMVITSFLDEVIAEVKRLRPEVQAGLLLGFAPPHPHLRALLSELGPIPRARACHADFVAPHFALARLGLLQRADEAGLPVFVWTVNDERTLRRLLSDDRVTAVITDVPARALELRAELV